MVDRDGHMLTQLQAVIDASEGLALLPEERRQWVIRAVRANHAHYVGRRQFVIAYACNELLRMLEDSQTVSQVRRELRAINAETPHSNRGVTHA